jgi:hypothetical protein
MSGTLNLLVSRSILKKQFKGNNMKFFLLLLITFSSLSFSQTYEILFDVNNASGWYGGDDRPGNQRNVADAQSVTIYQPINLESFAVRFSGKFDFAQNPTGTGHEVTLRLRIRDSIGTVLHTQDLVLADTFSGGWAAWESINYNINQPGKFIFSHHLVGGYDSLQVNTGIVSDFNGGYSGGERYAKYVVNDSDAMFWGDWSMSPWDANFHLIGTLLPTDLKENEYLPSQFSLYQNSPNPFNPGTKIKYSIPNVTLSASSRAKSRDEGSLVQLKVYDILGNEVATLVDEYKPAGSYKVNFNASFLSSGVYFYKLQAGSFVETKKMILLR